VKIINLMGALLASAGMLCAAQAPPQPVVTFIWQSDNPACTTRYFNGSQYAAIFTNISVVTVSIGYNAGKTAVGIIVSNRKDSKRRLEVLPENVRLFRVTPKGLEEQKRVEAEKLARRMERSARIGAALSGAGAAFSQTTATGTATYSDGTTADYSVSMPNTQAQAQARASGQEGIARSQAAGADVVAVELKRNTLFPGQDTGGQVFFKDQKKGDMVLVEVIVGNASYHFPMQLAKKNGLASVRDALPLELAQ